MKAFSRTQVFHGRRLAGLLLTLAPYLYRRSSHDGKRAEAIE